MRTLKNWVKSKLTSRKWRTFVYETYQGFISIGIFLLGPFLRIYIVFTILFDFFKTLKDEDNG